MRIVAGQWRGRRIVAPPGRDTRPTSDRVREALFSILGPLDGTAVLDLFAGSGALALEALSRGAARAVLVERAPAALKAIRANLEALGASAEVRARDVRAFVRDASAAGGPYDLVFLDPPYRDAAGLGPALELAPLLADSGRVVSETDRRAPLALPALEVTDERRYGDTMIRIHTLP
ncbi:16S rRNA (guanine(966)-N(2))-methyltransferase RsmD [Capillimicrobium parvum]|uniref:Ribosomal RNA small subunit methyltransferase D n=1 Tax=Capillimicrobium parvum TaxID=2884022 RepID=A0A9E6XX70_9ACTN|nr:16S rRNA (guanine(966)-N(2))-methyltransferase RsmD [Capillimicrobium parvum]UGS35830.1 Ribosomal RNA small subunit methyltransferase D [Capillimicrobium parvum]